MSVKPCDSCKLAKSLLFCRADSAFLCMNCDSTIHSRSRSQPHERVWLCDLCEQAPASVTCRADAAVLCVTCDRDIHSANPLAVRHERVPVVPFYESPASGVKFNTGNILEGKADEEETEAVSWLLPHAKVEEAPGLKMTGEFFFSDVDPYFDMDYVPSIDVGFQRKSSAGSDGVVPVQSQTSSVPHPPCSVAEFFIDFSGSKPVPQPPFNYSTQSLTHSVSSSSLDVGVVPEGIDITTGPTAIPTTPAVQLTGLDREARVLRYKEKRKNRKFEKTIRYASRKAYAETRPRIKGRFVKRTETESEVINRLYSSPISFMADSMGYGVVPTF